jgi:tetratricopeptide (TPR) repeat protein
MAHKHHKLTKKQLLIILGVIGLIVVAFGAGVLVWWLQHKNTASTPANGKVVGSQSDHALLKPAADAQQQALKGDTQGAVTTIQNALKQPNVSNDDKYTLLVQEGVTYSNNHQYQQALDVLKQAEAVSSTFTTSHLIAEQAEALGDKATALTYYKKALTQLDPNAISYRSDKTFYENKVRSLGGTP